MTRKAYMIPQLTVEFGETEQMMALSLQSGKADNSDALTKGAGGWDDIWGGENDAAIE